MEMCTLGPIIFSGSPVRIVYSERDWADYLVDMGESSLSRLHGSYLKIRVHIIPSRILR